ncbi:MAG: hypothetical protein A2041_01250 [Bacteroidetes bacterium GWA2_31_9b]|nr:MAG: hypothetical protein A2041_01250 [Bacteroidetes bacterium GWA2_31_9b]
MKTFKTNYLILMIIISSVLTFNSCEREKIFPEADNSVEELYNIMDYYYLWNDSLPTVDVEDYSKPEDLLEALRYTPRDKWSYISTKQEESQYYDEGTYTGHGFSYSADMDGKIRISYLFESSSLNDAGIKRGWIINKINGTPIDENSDVSSLLGASTIGVTNSFEFESPAGTILNQSFSKELITINTVLHKSVITVDTKKVGYLVFESFINPSIDELTDAFIYFKAENVTDLIVDLRYNGGGLMSVVEHLASLIIPDRLNNQLFLTYIHNHDLTSENFSYNFKLSSYSLGLEKVYFIATNGSASASEAIINGLDPYLDILIIGDDSYGKPVGMYSFESNVSDYVYVPITFKIINSAGYGEYYDGLTADAYADDDLTHDFGDVNESSLAEALYHIRNGSFSSKKSKLTIKRQPKKEIRTPKDELGAY